MPEILVTTHPHSYFHSRVLLTVIVMAGIRSLFFYTAILFAASTYAAIGPVTDLTISNADVAPDGFKRAAVVVNGKFPGPLIAGHKVSLAI